MRLTLRTLMLGVPVLLESLGCGPIGEQGSTPNPATGGQPNDPAGSGAAGTSAAGTSAAGSEGGSPEGLGLGGSGGAPPVGGAWDWAGVIGTGQSLAVGTLPTNPTVNQQPFENLMLSLSGVSAQPFDDSAASLAVVPLVEPLRAQGSGFPRAYPGNLWGETPHGAMAAQISALAAPGSYVSVHSVVGESGQGLVALKKGAQDMIVDGGTVGRAYAASMFEAKAIARLASAAGKTYGVGAIVMTHGETDAGNSSYEAELVQLALDYNADLALITGQTQKIPMIVSQHHAYGFTAGARSGASASTLVQWLAGVNHPDEIVCSGPKYQYPYIADGIHLEVRGYEMLGEKYGQVYYERVVLRRDWHPLQPSNVERAGRVVSVSFEVPVAPLGWDEALPAPHTSALTEWAAGRGFELSSGNTPLVIEAVEIVADTVQITAAADVPAGAVVGYAVTSDGTTVPGLGHRWGQLRDSDPFVGVVTGVAQPNYSVAFERSVP